MIFESQVKGVKALASQRQYDAAMLECELLLEHFPDKSADVYRLRAYIYSLQGLYEKAILEREALIDSGHAAVRDYYQIGDNAIAVHRFADANRWLRCALDLGEAQNETWFRSATFFLLAYANLQMGELQGAMSYLDQAVAIDPDCALPIGRMGMLTHNVLRDEIEQRIRHQKGA